MTLTQIAIFTKRSIIIFLGLVVLSLIAFISYRIWYSRYLASLPNPADIPDTKFGILPFPDFPPSSVSSSNFSYALDTPTGGLPIFPKVAKVYFMPKQLASLLSPEKSVQLAAKFNFSAPPNIISETIYQFKEGGKTLTVNLDSGNFVYQKESSAAAQISPSISEKELVQNFKNFLDKLLPLPEELKRGSGKLVSNTISLFPQDVDKLPMLTTAINKGLILATSSSSAFNLEDYLTINYTFWPVDKTTFSVYPLKSAEEAFADLRTGKGVILQEPAKPQVSIASIYLAYYQGLNYSPYLIPMVVFQGPEFAAFVPAVPANFINPAK